MTRISIVIILLMPIHQAITCDICGCSSGSYFIGPYPHFQKKVIGVRYSFRSYYSQMTDEPTEFSKDLYQTIELWAGTNIGKRWQLLLFLPYNINRQEMEHHPHKEHGLGDVTLLTNYQVLNKNNNQLWIGGGLKLPTGKFNPGFDHHPVPSANIQPGTGSIDLLLNATDIYQAGNWSIYSNVNYKLNGQRKEFRFGDRLNVSALLSHSLNTGKLSFAPYAGIQYEFLKPNKYKQAKIEDTGGQALLGTGGIDVQVGRINVGLNMQLPIAQNFSNSQTDIKLRGMLQVMYIF